MLIRPVTDLRNHYPDVEKDLRESGVVYLTKNGYGTAVLISLDEYTALTGGQDAPAFSSTDHEKPKASEGRGFLRKFANPDLMPLEKEAGRMHAARKHRNYTVEGDDE